MPKTWNPTAAEVEAILLGHRRGDAAVGGELHLRRVLNRRDGIV